MSETRVAVHVFGDASANSFKENVRQFIHQAVLLMTGFLFHTDRRRIATILYDYSPGEPPYYICSSLRSSMSSLDFETPMPLIIGNEPPPDVSTDLIVSSHAKASHSRALGSPVSIQMNYGLGRLIVVNRTSGDLSLAFDTTRPSSFSLVADPTIQDTVADLHPPSDEADNNSPEPATHSILPTDEHPKPPAPDLTPISTTQTPNAPATSSPNHTTTTTTTHPPKTPSPYTTFLTTLDHPTLTTLRTQGHSAQRSRRRCLHLAPDLAPCIGPLPFEIDASVVSDDVGRRWSTDRGFEGVRRGLEAGRRRRGGGWRGGWRGGRGSGWGVALRGWFGGGVLRIED